MRLRSPSFLQSMAKYQSIEKIAFEVEVQMKSLAKIKI